MDLGERELPGDEVDDGDHLGLRLSSAPGRTRTCNLMIRSHLLCPIELQGLADTYYQEASSPDDGSAHSIGSMVLLSLEKWLVCFPASNVRTSSTPCPANCRLSG